MKSVLQILGLGWCGCRHAVHCGGSAPRVCQNSAHRLSWAAGHKCLHLLCLQHSLSLTQTADMLQEVERMEWQLTLPAPSSLSRAVQSTHWVSVTLSQLENQAGALPHDRFSESQPVTSAVNPNLLGDVSI